MQFFNIPKSPSRSKPLMQRFMQENTGATKAAIGTYKRPPAPRNPIAQAGPASVLLTWNGPQNQNYVLGYRIYQGSENNQIMDIPNPGTTQASINLSSGSRTMLYVSAYSSARESVKVPVLAPAAGAASSGNTSPPPGFPNEPTGGGSPDGGGGKGGSTF